jgi:PAS domain S-box-containing protein
MARNLKIADLGLTPVGLKLFRLVPNRDRERLIPSTAALCLALLIGLFGLPSSALSASFGNALSAFHEPSFHSGVSAERRQSSKPFPAALSRDAATPRFMVPMRGNKAAEAAHEPGQRVEFLSAAAGRIGTPFLLIGTMAFLIFAGLAWVFFLRRHVRHQTAAIHEEKNLLATLLDHLPDNVYVKDPEGRYLLTNLAHARFHGVESPSFFRGKSGFDLFTPDQARSYADADAKVLSGGTEPFTYEERVVNGAGAVRCLATTKVPLRGQNGKIMGLVGFSRDITESRRADDALRVSEERFRAIWEHSIDGMRLTDHDGRIIAVNQAFCHLVKLPREKLVGQLLSVSYSDDGSASHLQSYLERFQAGKIVPRTTARIRFWNGEEKDVELSSCFVDLGQQGRTVLSILRDVSERRRVESVLAYERDLLTTLFDNLPDALYFKDLSSRFVRVSKSKLESSWAMALTRHRFSAANANPASIESQEPDPNSSARESLPAHLASREAFAEYIIGKTDFDFFDEARARHAFEDEQEIIRTGQALIGKVEQTNHLDGRVTWSLSTKMPWLDKDGRLIGTFGVSKDITPIKQAEASVERVHKQLMEASRQAGMAEVATGVLHNVGNVLNSVNVSANLLSEKLLQSRTPNLAKVAGLLREHSSQLAEFMTNDSRGRQLPLYLNQLAERLASEQALLLKEVGCLAKNVEHIKNIVAMQQAYARPVGITESVQVVDLVEDAFRINHGALARHNVQISRDYEPHLRSLTIDKHKVLQILVNLISNAAHACAQAPPGDKRLTVCLADAGDRLRISVRDNGVGIAPENLTRIFSLGFTTRPDGHGFGLHSGALAAREMGGSLLSHSDGPGLGATFVLELPITAQF